MCNIIGSYWGHYCVTFLVIYLMYIKWKKLKYFIKVYQLINNTRTTIQYECLRYITKYKFHLLR